MIKVTKKNVHIIVEESIKRELKSRAGKQGTTIGEIVKELLQKDKNKKEDKS